MMWLDLVVAFSCGGGGLVCGWVMHAIGGFGNHTLVKHAAASIAQPEIHAEPTRERISEVANRLKAYALSMAENVDAHQTRVQAVNDTLLEGNDTSPGAVVQAVGQLIDANETMQKQLQEAQDRIHEQAAQIESAERRAQTDALTRVPNRRAFDSRIKKQHEMGRTRPSTLALLDVDHFKQFNDVYGHRAGDEVLRIVANVMHARLHSYGLVARFGGEEFAVILDGYSVDQAKELIEATRIAIGDREIQFEDKRLRVTVSAGVAELVAGEDVEAWLQRADDAMYRSKEAGRDCGHWMDGTIPVRIERSRQIDQADGQPAGPVLPTEPVVAPQDSGGRGTDRAIHRETQDGEASNQYPAKRGSGSTSASDSTSKTPAQASKTDPGALAYVRDRETLGAAYADLRGRTQSSVAVFVMAIVCDPETSSAAMRTLLQVVRATMRSVDQIGCENDSSLLICMPSVDDATAYDRGRQICRSAEALGMGDRSSGEHRVTVGIAESGPTEEFDEVVSRVLQLAKQCRGKDSNPVCLQQQAASA